MIIEKTLSVLSLTTGIIGSFLMYYYTPKIESQIYLYTKLEEEKLRQIAAYKNKMVRIGMLLLFISFLLQLSTFFLNT
jgi:accessory gene regulator protein AgrB